MASARPVPGHRVGAGVIGWRAAAEGAAEPPHRVLAIRRARRHAPQPPHRPGESLPALPCPRRRPLLLAWQRRRVVPPQVKLFLFFFFFVTTTLCFCSVCLTDVL